MIEICGILYTQRLFIIPVITTTVMWKSRQYTSVNRLLTCIIIIFIIIIVIIIIIIIIINIIIIIIISLSLLLLSV